MNVEEFLQGNKSDTAEEKEITEESVELSEQEDVEVELDVQKAVVESLAADKAEQDEHIDRLENDIAALTSEVERLKKELTDTKAELEKVKAELNKAVDLISIDDKSDSSNTVSLLERNIEMPDRFAGETRDHVLEAVKEKRDRAEQEGRIRCVQLMEAVMVVNEPSGELQKKRAALVKFFNENQNILSGTVIAELEKYGISYKKGEEYLLPEEIIRRTY
jgi:septal ring factor EnvC (AmiA/AmiB activator)